METKLKCCKVSVIKGEETTFSWLPNTENTLSPELVINSWLTLNCSKQVWYWKQSEIPQTVSSQRREKYIFVVSYYRQCTFLRTGNQQLNNFELFQTFSKFNPGNKVKCCKVSVVKGEKSTFSWFPNTENVLFSGLVINSYHCSKPSLSLMLETKWNAPKCQ